MGLPPGLRRRTPGLRREEVAQLAGVGVTWYTWLEQGRPIKASAQVLGAVAQTLRLDQAERQHLYRLADIAEAAGGSGVTVSACEQVPPDVQGIMDSLVPLPASVLNERYDLLGWNEAYAALWPGVIGAQPGERNILWQNFTHPDCCHPYVSRHDQLGRLVAQFRGNYGRHIGEPAWTSLIRRLQGASPHFARLWEEHDVANPVTYPEDLPAPGVPAAGHDEHQPRRAGRARHPDGRLHARRRGMPGRDRQVAGRGRHRRPVPVRSGPREAPRRAGGRRPLTRRQPAVPGVPGS